MPQQSNRKSRDDKSGNSGRSTSGRSQKSTSKRNFSGERSARSGDRPSDNKPGRRKPYSGDSTEWSDKKTFKKPYGERGTSDRSKPFGEKRFSDDRKSRTGDKPYAGKKPFGDRKPFGKRTANTHSNRNEEPGWTSEEKFHVPTRSKKAKESDELIRLNRYISNAGICSRRKADELIAAGVITVNGEVVSELGHKVNPAKDAIRYNGELLKREKMVYVLLNKPKDYITTTDDPQERRTVMQLIEKASRERIYPVGRLDRNTTGLLLFTNDGDLAEKLSHPKNNITKLYHVELNKSLSQGDLNKIAFGLELEDGPIKPDSIAYVQGGSKREVGIQIHSGKNRIVRRIFEHLGYEVVKLDRAVYANLTKKDLPRGKWRYLNEKEIIQLKHLIH
ncbi:rRNA pseudouridine synthase [Pedobacter sp. BS3]|uniref:pseudouridine synthase n=1 Tax=Pedobacter sp. BS3 TaxID=2567937 RepID=UPI0011EFAF12|nr:pseudouridine synthase [Pedobacter sp. BS3]TZF81689.1 rRNA pseudouridine synthase [Pedobacter sp. BS3]